MGTAPLRLVSWNVGMNSPLPQGERHTRAWNWLTGEQPDVLLLQQVIPGRFADGWPATWSRELDERGCRVAVAARPGLYVRPLPLPEPSWARYQGRSAAVAATVQFPDGPEWTVVSVQVGYDESGTRWLRHVIDAFAGHRGPLIVGGDFNRPVSRPPAASRMFTLASYAGFHFVCCTGGDLLPTVEGSQIDHLWTRGLPTADLRWEVDGTVRDRGLAGHAALRLTVRPAFTEPDTVRPAHLEPPPADLAPPPATRPSDVEQDTVRT